jgi:7-carboxy-7-deazaguanine synthase
MSADMALREYPVVEIFKSLQGEGHFVGYPMTFIRLAGCSVIQCAIREQCDEAPWKAGARMSAREIGNFAANQTPFGTAVITGGEPTDHDLLPIIEQLKAHQMRVHIETSGVRSVEGYPFDWITVSPKTPDYVQRTGHTLKVVMRSGMTWRELDEVDDGTCFFHRYLQPVMQLDGSTNLSEVVAFLISPENRRGRWALSTQAHKGWGLK